MSEVEDLWDFEDPVGSERRFRAEATGSRKDLMLTQVARALGLQGKYDEGHGLLDGLADPTGEVLVRVHLERGRLLRSSGDPDSALPHFVQAAEAAGRSGLTHLRIDALHMQALVVPPDQVGTIHDEALRLARGSTDPRARDWDASLLNNVGMARADAGDLHGALASFEEALAARLRIGKRAEIRIARWMVAWTLRRLGRTEEALVQQLALKADLESTGDSDPYVDEELALLTGS